MLKYSSPTPSQFPGVGCSNRGGVSAVGDKRLMPASVVHHRQSSKSSRASLLSTRGVSASAPRNQPYEIPCGNCGNLVGPFYEIVGPQPEKLFVYGPDVLGLGWSLSLNTTPFPGEFKANFPYVPCGWFPFFIFISYSFYLKNYN